MSTQKVPGDYMKEKVLSSSDSNIAIAILLTKGNKIWTNRYSFVPG